MGYGLLFGGVCFCFIVNVSMMTNTGIIRHFKFADSVLTSKKFQTCSRLLLKQGPRGRSNERGFVKLH
jgi:hypothetical protein